MKSKPFTIKAIKADPKLVRVIMKGRGVSKEYVLDRIGRHNVILSKHLADLTGKRADAIITLSRVELKDGKPYSRLTRRMPFNVDGESDNTKTMFIELDEKCKKFLIECNS